MLAESTVMSTGRGNVGGNLSSFSLTLSVDFPCGGKVSSGQFGQV